MKHGPRLVAKTYSQSFRETARNGISDQPYAKAKGGSEMASGRVMHASIEDFDKLCTKMPAKRARVRDERDRVKDRKEARHFPSAGNQERACGCGQQRPAPTSARSRPWPQCGRAG